MGFRRYEDLFAFGDRSYGCSGASSRAGPNGRSLSATGDGANRCSNGGAYSDVSRSLRSLCARRALHDIAFDHVALLSNDDAFELKLKLAFPAQLTGGSGQDQLQVCIIASPQPDVVANDHV
jgi:hypothetical protein